jgi:hypothetical protein
MSGHQWVESNLGHGGKVCSKCHVTMKEAFALDGVNCLSGEAGGTMTATDEDIEAVARALCSNDAISKGLSDRVWKVHASDAQAAIAALEVRDWQKVPEECVVVPREPTNAMLKAARAAKIYLNVTDFGWRSAYRAMIGAKEG